MTPPQPSYAFPARETLHYEVDWRVFPAGTASIHLEQQGDTMRVTGEGETIEALNLLFRVNDKFQSSFDRKTGCSYGFSKQIVEGKRQVNTDLKFDYSQRKSFQYEKNLVSGIVKNEASGDSRLRHRLAVGNFLRRFAADPGWAKLSDAARRRTPYTCRSP